jgi:putative hemolysin
MIDGGHYAANLYTSLPPDALTAPEYRAFPHTPLPVEELRTGASVSPPPLVKGYLRLGAKICGAPAWDPDFNTADFLTLFRLSEINARYARHFIGDMQGR